jgi:hypothetical protein
MAVSIISGGLVGFYIPTLAGLLGIIFAACAFYLPNNKSIFLIAMTSSVMFIIFTLTPSSIHESMHYLGAATLVVALFGIFHLIFDKHIYPNEKANLAIPRTGRVPATLIAIIALSLGYFIEHVLATHTTLQHLYWIPMTIIVVIQGTHQDTLKTSLLRIGVNIAGALLVIILFSYIVPNIFWVNIGILVICLFCIFALGFSHIYRTLFIEVFVLSLVHMLGQYHNTLAYDRMGLTLIGGSLVILATLSVNFATKIISQHKRQSIT